MQQNPVETHNSVSLKLISASKSHRSIGLDTPGTSAELNGNNILFAVLPLTINIWIVTNLHHILPISNAKKYGVIKRLLW